MNFLRYLKVLTAIILVVVGLSLAGVAQQNAGGNALSFAFAGEVDGFETPEAAATNMFRACVSRSPKLFTQVRLIGVCDGPIHTLNKYAECLHTTTYSNGKNAVTIYDLRKQMKDETIRVTTSQAFTDDEVDSLSFQFVSTYYGEQFICYEVAAVNYDGLEYRTRIVAAKLSDRWYAIPRCRSSKSFYEIADAMRFPAPESDEAA